MNGKMLKMLVAAGAALGVMAGAPSADAACTKPVGRFVGAAAGTILTTGTSGVLYNAAAISLSINIANDGSLTATEQGKTLNGVYSTTWKVGAGKNSFSTTTCQGTLVTNYGDRFTYTSSASGNVMTLIYTKNNSLLALYTVRLEKA